ncbi:conserved hypothetical protein [Thermotomaculum hydrothermale]|uniref:Thioredoxin domain-containing protein n=1 Tax=Thermotomaculum hydrothermale TaxID=981385 RepID=A0A7R6SZQ3_9BACT|nr:nitrophenyl compound nitroreductase subunit ArsF family protein [Thermotomaculum hydrothermale]BBB33045.1 conserved hypothetical protein [Thermotomaculum hydrothermale]
MKKIFVMVMVVLTAFSFALAKGTIKGASSSVKKHSFVLYYFYSYPRCSTCKAIEANADFVVKEHFKKELKKGVLAWKPVDVDKPENKHFIKEFKLYTKSLVLAKIKNGKVVRYKILQKVWQVVYEPYEFENYIVNSVKNFMKE